MSDRMQTLKQLKTVKTGAYHRTMANNRSFVSLAQSFVNEVTKDQAASVFLTANARLLVKAKTH